ncbi:condensation protein [Streptomyces sp. NPDC020883]|uniref:condensation protein n=1 Tax=Streptomyces sp. NPDC020883 TaxID=3365099 RepID=UPI003788A0D0
MTALQPARHDPPQARGARHPADARVPFPLVDEISRHCLEDAEPETVHIEVHLPGRLDHERLRTAFHQALARHPRVLMRQVPTRWWHRHYTWQLTPAPDVDPVAFPPPGPDALARARTRALTECPPLDASPPLRLEVIEPPPTGGNTATSVPGGTVLLLTVHHTALDGPACLRILATAAELYAETPDMPPPPAPTPHTVHPLPPVPLLPSLPSRPNPLTRPARLAPDHTTTATTAPPTGNGLLLTDLPLPTRTPHPTNQSSRPLYTINDQLLVATYLMTTRWNQLHHHRPTAPVVLTMPIDDRPPGPHMPIGNGTRLTQVTFPPPPPPPPPLTHLLHQTAARTRALKSAAPTSQLGLPATLLAALPLPVGPRRALVRALRTLAAPWSPTALVSNIGRIPYPLDFGEAGGRATAVWFSAPARMPRGLSITTAATHDGDRVHLALRWSRALLDDASAAQLLALLRSSFATTHPTPGPLTPPTGQGSPPLDAGTAQETPRPQGDAPPPKPEGATP